jgi:branched-chain amino acid transport system permease protein
LLLLLPLCAVFFSGNAYLINLSIVTALFTLPALGLSLLMGYTGQISLGHAAFVGLGAYGTAMLCKGVGLNPWMAIVAGTLFAAFAAWAIGWLVFRLRGHYLAMATLAFGIIIHLVTVGLRGLTGGQDGLSGIPSLSVFGYVLNSDAKFFPFVWGVCILAIMLAGNLVHSPAGYAMRAVAESEPVASSVGIAPDRLKRHVMALSGLYAGLGGALYAHYLGYISPSPFDVDFSVRLLMMVAMGGFAGIWSVLFGTLFIVVAGELLKPFGTYDTVLYGTLLVIVMIWCPRGLLEGIGSLWRRFFRIWRRGEVAR